MFLTNSCAFSCFGEKNKSRTIDQCVRQAPTRTFFFFSTTITTLDYIAIQHYLFRKYPCHPPSRRPSLLSRYPNAYPRALPPIPTGGAQKRGAAVVLRRRPRRVRFIANDFFVDVSEVLSGTTGMDFPFETVFAESACEAEGRVTTPMTMHGASSPDGDSRKTSRGEMFFRVHRSCMQDGPPREGNSTAASLAAFRMFWILASGSGRCLGFLMARG